MLIPISKNYTEEAFCHSFCFNLETEHSKENCFDPQLVPADIEQFCNLHTQDSVDHLRSNFDYIQPIQRKQQRHRDINKVIKNALGSIPKDGQVITVDDEEKVWTEFMKYISSRIKI